MKRIFAMLLAAAMVASITACGSKEEVSDTPLEVLTNVWAAYDDEEKFAAGGGDPENPVMDEPGTFNPKDAENLDVILGFPQHSVALLDDAASLVHMMNANTFTAGAYHVADASEVEMLVGDLQDNIMNRQWMCGFPDTLIIFQIGDDTLVSAFGNAEVVETFKTKLLSVYEDAEVKCEESLI